MQQPHGFVQATAIDQPRGAKRGGGEAERLDAILLKARHAASHVLVGGVDPRANDAHGAQAVDEPRGVTEPGVLDTCWNRLKPGGRLIANAVTLQSEATLVAFRERQGGELTRIAIAQAQPLGGFDTWRSALPITLLEVSK